MKIPELFGSHVFHERVMRERLPKDIYRAVKHTIDTGGSLDTSIADVVAGAMRDWAIELGATHFTHWFQPMTGITAEKHDSFISSVGECAVIMEFRGRELIRGESDASSFPSGGLRATFEARGHTAWDPTSYAFVRGGTLFIPCAFYSHSGEALDMKTPLLRSMKAVGEQARRVLALLGTPVDYVIPSVGAEQEYFLVPKAHFERRRDLKYTGRTLFGSRPPKGQQLEDHYYGSIKPEVAAFMRDMDEELWRLGVPAKTQHNEAAPAQHELAPIHEKANLACDHNQLIMDVMKNVARRHGLICLLHEKPFDGINGSGKHNNWSLITSSGENLFDAKKNPSGNTRFLLFLAAVIMAAAVHGDLLRVSAASASNDNRLGADEAPPAIISLFLGTELEEVLESIVQGTDYVPHTVGLLDTSVEAVPNLYIDTTDRNRTSPFAFTGGKFEFRMPGSSQSIAEPNIVLNTITADALDRIAGELESGKAPLDIVREILKNYGHIIFNGNNYAPEWTAEAARRGLPNLRSTADAAPHYKSEENIALFEKYKVLSRAEIASRAEIMLENYAKITSIEAQTMISMVRREILPAAVKYSQTIADTALLKRELGVDASYEIATASELSAHMAALSTSVSLLDRNTNGGTSDSVFCRDVLLPLMRRVREAADAIERLVGDYPFPTYDDLLFGI